MSTELPPGSAALAAFRREHRVPLVIGGVPSGAPVKPGRGKRRGAFQENPRGLLKEGEHVGPPGAWLFQAVDPGSAEYTLAVGSLLPTGRADFREGKWFYFSKLFSCPGACVPQALATALLRGGVGRSPAHPPCSGMHPPQRLVVWGLGSREAGPVLLQLFPAHVRAHVCVFVHVFP